MRALFGAVVIVALSIGTVFAAAPRHTAPASTLASHGPTSVVPPVSVPVVSSLHALTHDDLEAYLDGYFPDALSRADIAGAVVVVVKDGQILIEKGYGYSDLDARKPVVKGGDKMCRMAG